MKEDGLKSLEKRQELFKKRFQEQIENLTGNMSTTGIDVRHPTGQKAINASYREKYKEDK